MDRRSIIPRRGRWDAHPRDARARAGFLRKRSDNSNCRCSRSPPPSAPGRFRVKIRSPRPGKAPIWTNWPIKMELRSPFVYLRVAIIALARYLWSRLMPEVINELGIFIAQVARCFRRREGSPDLFFFVFFFLYAESAVRRFSIYSRNFSKMCYLGDRGFHSDRIYDAPFPTDGVT